MECILVAFKVYWDVNLRNPLRTGDEVSDKESTVALKPMDRRHHKFKIGVTVASQDGSNVLQK